MPLPPAFIEYFGAHFNADLVEIDDTDQLRDQAIGCAASLNADSRVDGTQLVADLKHYERNLDTKAMLQLTEVANVDWLEDDETKAALRYALAEIIKSLERHASQHG